MAIPSTGFTFPPANNTDFITELYVGYYNRAPDPAGMNFWLNALASGETLTQVANQFANSSESTAIYPFLTLPNLVNAGSFVTQVYNNILNRAPDAPGLAFWTAELQSGAVTPGSFIVTLEASVNMQTGTADALTLAAKGTVAEDYVLRVASTNTPFTQASAHASLAPVSGIGNSPATPAEVTAGEAVTTAYIGNPVQNTIILTTGLDAPTINGNNNTVLGVIGGATPTYTPGDTLVANAGSTNNILQLSDAGVGGNTNISAVATTVSNFSALNINSGEGVTVNTATSSAGFTGLATLNITSAAPNGGAFADNVTAAATTNITVNDTATKSFSTGGNNLTVNGGLAVTVTETNTDGGASPFIMSPISIGATTAAAGLVTVNNTDTTTVIGNTVAAITVKGAAGVTVNDTINQGAGTTGAPITVTGGAAAIAVTETNNFTALVGATGTPGTITTNGGTTVAVTEAVSQAQTVTGAGTSVINEGAVAVNGGSATTTVTVTQANVAVGSGAIAASAGTTFVNAVAAVTAAPGVAPVAAVTGVAFVAPVTAVAGTPTVNSDGVVTIADKTNTSTATSTITTVSLSGYGAGSSIAGAALTNLSLAGTGGALAINNGAAAAATNTTLALALNGLSNTAANTTITDTNSEITTLNITTGAASSKLDGFVDANLKTLNVAGASTLTFGTNPAALTTIAVSGAAGFTDANLAALAGQLKSFTTTSSGVITATLDDTTQTFVGSTGQDIISLVGNASKAITGGSATNNEVVLTAANATVYTAAGFGTNVTGFTTLGVNDTNNQTNTYDMHNIFKGYTAIDLQSSNDTATFTGVTAGTTLAIDANEAAVSYVLFTPSGTSTVSTTLGLASNVGNINVGTLTLTDSNADGVATANIISNAKTATGGVVNSISTLADTSLSTLNISGNGALGIGNPIVLGTPGLAVPVGVAALTINNTSTAFNSATNSLVASTIFGITDDTLGALTFGGTNGVAITNVVDNNAANLTISSTDTASVSINSLSTDANAAKVISNGLSNLTFSGSGVVNVGTETLVSNTAALVITNSGTATDSIGNIVDTGSAGLGLTTSLTVSGNVTLGANSTTALNNLAGAVALTDTAGVTVAAGTDNAHISVALLGAVGGKTDTITVGNGNDAIADGSTLGTVNVTVGTGQNYIDLGAAGTHSAGSAAYLANVTLGAHTAPDQVLTIGMFSSATPNPNTIITGLAAGDFITPHDAVTSVTTLSSTILANAAAAGTIAQAVGIADTGLAAHSAATFVFGANTYLIETIATGTGAIQTGDTVVELVGTHTLSPTITAGHLALLT